MSFLYRYEAKGIQAFILATDKLREMVGASALVERLEDEVRAAFAGPLAGRGRICTAAAGSATLAFERLDDLAAFASTWPLRVRALAPGLHVVQAWVEGGADQLPALMAALGAQRNVVWPDLPEAGPATLRAARTGRAAVERRQELLADAPTVAKAGAYDVDRLGERLSVGLPEGSRFARANDELGVGPLALVHVDGNGVGRRVVGQRGLEGYQAFSLALAEATVESARAAIAQALWPEDTRRPVPARPLVLGGDDLTLLLPAPLALDFVKVYLEQFEERTAASPALGGGLTACAGVALVPAKWPFSAAHRLAESLCRAAKAGLRAGGETRSGVLFHRVTTSLVDDVPALDRTELAARGPDGVRVGAMRYGPYALRPGPAPTLDDLLHAHNALAFLARGRLREWARIVREDERRAEHHWARTREVLAARDAHGLGRVDERLRALGVNPQTGFGPGGRTPIPDVLTLQAVGRSAEAR